MVILLLVLLLLMFGGLPPLGLVAHPYGYYPSGLFFVLIVVLLILMLTGRL